jgi:hypothetical protein
MDGPRLGGCWLLAAGGRRPHGGGGRTPGTAPPLRGMSAPRRQAEVARQKVVLRIDTKRCVARGWTELQVETKARISELRLHCRQAQVLSVTVDEKPADFEQADPLALVVNPATLEDQKITAGAFDRAYAEASRRCSEGELTVTLPSPSGPKCKLTLRIDFVLARPATGARFVEGAEGVPRAPHFYAAAVSSRCAGGAGGSWGARMWFPCDDAAEVAHPIELVITTPCTEVAVCSGHLDKHTATDHPAEVLHEVLANARVDDGDESWDVWQSILERVSRFLAEYKRLPRADDWVQGSAGSARRTAVRGAAVVTAQMEAWLAEWCNHQKVRWGRGELSEHAIERLESLPGWEWESMRTSYFKIKKPVAASAIVLAVGPFVVLPDPHLGHVAHTAVPGRGRPAELEHTVATFHEIYDFIEGYAGKAAVPHRGYSQAFVDGMELPAAGPSSVGRRQFGDGWAVGYGCALLSSDLLHGPGAIEQAIDARHAMAEALASQCFGVTIQAVRRSKSSDKSARWLVLALARFVALKYLGHAFGTTFYRHTLSEDAAITYETCDDYPKLSAGLCAETCSARLLDYLARRGTLVLHMVEQRVGVEALQDTIRELAASANGAQKDAKKKSSSFLTTKYFFDCIERHSRLSVKSFVDKWVDKAPMPRLQCGYCYHQRQNETEYVMQQFRGMKLNLFKGPVSIRLYSKTAEPTDQTVQMEDKVEQLKISNKGRAKRTHTSRSRSGATANRAATAADVAASTGGTAAEGGAVGVHDEYEPTSETPVLWIRVDPKFHWPPACFSFVQPACNWVNQLRCERDVVAQAVAADALAQQFGPAVGGAARIDQLQVNVLQAPNSLTLKMCRSPTLKMRIFVRRQFGAWK